GSRGGVVTHETRDMHRVAAEGPFAGREVRAREAGGVRRDGDRDARGGGRARGGSARGAAGRDRAPQHYGERALEVSPLPRPAPTRRRGSRAWRTSEPPSTPPGPSAPPPSSWCPAS